MTRFKVWIPGAGQQEGAGCDPRLWYRKPGDKLTSGLAQRARDTLQLQPNATRQDTVTPVNTVIVSGQPVTPSKVICVGRNYAAHIEELGNEVPGEMVVFLKPNSAIGSVLRAEFGEPLHYEGELAFAVQGGELAAVGFGLDLTRRELQGRLKADGLPWERAKAFDGAALFSEFVPLPDSGLDNLCMELDVDGEPRQLGDTALMLYPPRVILEQLAAFMHLEDGDILMTGTPAGVGVVRPGETFTGRVVARGEVLASASWQAR